MPGLRGEKTEAEKEADRLYEEEDRGGIREEGTGGA